MIDTFTITSEELEKRLDKLLSEKYPNLSRNYFERLIEDGHVLINGHPVKKRAKPASGDQIEISFKEPPLLDVKPEAIPLDILFEDEELIAVNKPAGMVIHPAPGSYSGTFANALLHHCHELEPEQYEALRPGIIHRLDKETSGTLIAAKTSDTHRRISADFANRNVEKTYLLLCCGRPPEGRYVAPIKRHPTRRKEMSVQRDGKEAITEFKVLKSKGDLCLTEAKLITGRTHQIRVHLKSLNCPILGDAIYGSSSLNKKYGANRQLLHSHTLTFTHPTTGKSLTLSSPIPSDMKNFIDQM